MLSFAFYYFHVALDLTDTPGETGPNMPERLRRDVTIRSTVQLKDIVCSHKTSAFPPKILHKTSVRLTRWIRACDVNFCVLYNKTTGALGENRI